MNKLTKTEITELDTEIKQLTIITANFLDHHNNNVDKHNYILVAFIVNQCTYC